MRCALCLLVLCSWVSLARAATWHVDDDALPGGDGASWATAFHVLQDAIDAAGATDEIWVAAGDYVPTTRTDQLDGRTVTFQLVNGVELYGGFAGNESLRDERRPLLNVTRLTGDINGDDGPNFANTSDNAYHVVTGSGTDATAIVDGFEISGGNAVDGSGNGGGMLIESGTPIARNCRFVANEATSGGGLYIDASNGLSLLNCLFIANKAGTGGGITSMNSTVTYTHCTIAGNSQGMTVFGPGTDVFNCVIWRNTGTNLSNQINGLANVNVAFSCVQSWQTPGVLGNISSDPLFVDPPESPSDPERNVALRLGSPCIDASNNSFVGFDVDDVDDNGVTAERFPIDGGGFARFQDSFCTADTGMIAAGAFEIADMGAIELQTVPAPAGTRLYVDASATGANDGSSWTNAYTDLQAALFTLAGYPCAVDEIWVAAGTYTPTSSSDRDASYVFTGSVEIYGGFSGGEAQLGDRNPDPLTNGTVLSGDIGAPGDSADNSRTIVYASFTDTGARLDGFTIRDGNADGDVDFTSPNSGAGIFVEEGNLLLQNCHVTNNAASRAAGMFVQGPCTVDIADSVFSDNTTVDALDTNFAGVGAVEARTAVLLSISGSRFSDNIALNGPAGAIYATQVNTLLTATDCLFERNASGFGGAILVDAQAAADFESCQFIDNESFSTSGSPPLPPIGGGLILLGVPGDLVNCLFVNNTAESDGGGIAVAGLQTTLTNCTFFGNSSGGVGGGILLNAVFCNIWNCVFWDNSHTGAAGSAAQIAQQGVVTLGVSHSCIMDTAPGDGSVFPGTGNIDLPPVFADAGSGNYRLGSGSPCIDSGNNAGGGLVAITTDLDGNARFLDDPASLDCTVLPGSCGVAPIVDMGAYEFEPLPCLLIGDINQDGLVNGNDVQGLADCLLTSVTPGGLCVCADADGNGMVTFDDLPGFLDELEVQIPIPGDINDDGFVDQVDLPLFVSVLLGVPQHPAHVQRADLNGDGESDGADIQGFAAVLVAP